MVIGKGSEKRILSRDEVKEIIRKGLYPSLVRGKRVLVLTPDNTRTAPLPMMIRIICEHISSIASQLDFMVALGTHKLLTEKEILNLYGIDEAEKSTMYKQSEFLNHRWDLQDTFIKIGRFSPSEIEEITNGLYNEGIDIIINKKVFDYDLIIILGPVFPHVVVGFSGGNKYLFPGISGGDFLHSFHWLSAIITNYKTIGRKYTPSRLALNRAASYLKIKCYCISMVVNPENKLSGLYLGNVEESWSSAVNLSTRLHIVYKKHPYRLVLGKASSRYDELWTAGKVMYKLEPIVEDGGMLIIYGTHINVTSHTWGRYIEKIGYHVRDYFLSQMDKFKDIPKAVLAHSTHVKGLGTYDSKTGNEIPRINVSLASSISPETCRKINLDYINPKDIKTCDYKNREEDGILFVDNAGETLYRLEDDKI